MNDEPAITDEGDFEGELKELIETAIKNGVDPPKSARESRRSRRAGIA